MKNHQRYCHKVSKLF